jgi:hypothetical protein
MKPTTPITLMPSKHIFIDSHSSSLPGLIESFKVRAHWAKNDLSPIVHRRVNDLD